MPLFLIPMHHSSTPVLYGNGCQRKTGQRLRVCRYATVQSRQHSWMKVFVRYLYDDHILEQQQQQPRKLVFDIETAQVRVVGWIRAIYFLP